MKKFLQIFNSLIGIVAIAFLFTQFTSGMIKVVNYDLAQINKRIEVALLSEINPGKVLGTTNVVLAATMPVSCESTDVGCGTPTPTYYTLSVAKSGSGTVTDNLGGINCGSTCSASYTSNLSVALVATPASGSIFTGWSGACSGTTSSCALTMNANKVVTATFATTNQSPTIQSSGAHSVTATEAALTMMIVPNNSATTVWFRYASSNPGTCNDTFGTKFPPSGSGLGSGMTPTGFTQSVAGLTPATTYYYCSIAENAAGKSFSSLKSFTTTNSTNNSVITVTSPTASSFWDIGTTHTITWQNRDGNSTSRNVQLYTSAPGSNTVCLIVNSVPDTGSYSWTIPTLLDPICKNQQILTVLRLDGSWIKGQSGIFSIREKLPDFVVSDIKIDKRSGDTQSTIYVTIKNIGTGTAGPDVILNTTIKDNNTGYIYKSGKTDNYIPGYVGDTASAEFLIPNSNHIYHFTAKVNDPTWLSESDYSNNTLSKTVTYNNRNMFKIAEVALFTSPYQPGTNITFKVRGLEPDGTWTAADEGFQASGQVYINDDPYQPVLYSTVTSYDPSTGWWTTTVPAPSVTGNYQMRIVIWCGFDYGKVCSDRYGSRGPQVEQMVPFKVGVGTISPLTIITPQGGEQWQKMKTYTVGWSTAGIPTQYLSLRPEYQFIDEQGNVAYGATFTGGTFVGSDDSRFGRTTVNVSNIHLTAGKKYRVRIIGWDSNNTKVIEGTSVGYVTVVDSITSRVCAGGTEIIKRSPLRNDEFGRLGLNINGYPEILRYRIQWFSGGWSDWYTPGIDDVDWKTNNDGSLRRVWAYFGDHNHEYEKCMTIDTGKPDLIVSDISLEPANPTIGQIVKIIATLKNIGAGDAYIPNSLPLSGPTANLKIVGPAYSYVEGSSGTTGTTANPPLKPGATATYSFGKFSTIQFPSAGEYTISVVADGGGNTSGGIGVIDESREDNNSLNKTIAINNPTTPTVAIIFPNGGEQWEVGKSYQIKWASSNLPIDAQNGIGINFDNGKGTTGIFGWLNNDGSETWTIPLTMAPGQYQLEITATNRLTNKIVASDKSNQFNIITALPAITCAPGKLEPIGVAGDIIPAAKGCLSAGTEGNSYVANQQDDSVYFTEPVSNYGKQPGAPSAYFSIKVSSPGIYGVHMTVRGYGSSSDSFLIQLFDPEGKEILFPGPAASANAADVRFEKADIIAGSNPYSSFTTIRANHWQVYSDRPQQFVPMVTWKLPSAGVYTLRVIKREDNATFKDIRLVNSSIDSFVRENTWKENIGKVISPILPSVISAEVLLQERIQKLEYRVSELEKQVVDNEKSLVTTVDPSLTNRVVGKILLQVEGKGEAWYVDKDTQKKFYLKDGNTAYTALQAFGLGISNEDLAKIKISTSEQVVVKDSDGDGLDNQFEEAIGTDPYNKDTDGDGYDDGVEVINNYSPLGSGRMTIDANLVKRLEGKIILAVHKRGEAFYISNGEAHYLKDGLSAYQIMRNQSLGITNNDLRKIQVGEFK